MRYACREVEGTPEPAPKVVRLFKQETAEGARYHCGNEVGTLLSNIQI